MEDNWVLLALMVRMIEPQKPPVAFEMQLDQNRFRYVVSEN
ncbi:MAG: hypothetical protein AB7F28_08100 [Candidatus Margulisiibacteriota bacterium]